MAGEVPTARQTSLFPDQFVTGNKWPHGFEIARYDSSLPLLYWNPSVGKIPFPKAPRFGYAPVQVADARPLSPVVAFGMVIPLERALRIVYEGFWALQAEIIDDWTEDLARAIFDTMLALAEDVLFAVLRGETFLLQVVIDRLLSELKDFNLNNVINYGVERTVNRMRNSCLLDARGKDYYEKLLSAESRLSP